MKSDTVITKHCVSRFRERWPDYEDLSHQELCGVIKYLMREGHEANAECKAAMSSMLKRAVDRAIINEDRCFLIAKNDRPNPDYRFAVTTVFDVSWLPDNIR